MRKILSGLIALCLVSGVVLAAEVPGDAMKAIRDIQKGVNNKNQIEDLRVLDSATIGGAVTVAGALTAASVTSTGATVLPAGSVTNENLGASSVTGVKIANGTISNEDISAAAAVAWDKLSNQVVVSNANVATTAGIAWSKIAAQGTITNENVGAVSAAKLTAGTAASAIDVGATTNYPERSLVYGSLNSQAVVFDSVIDETGKVINAGTMAAASLLELYSTNGVAITNLYVAAPGVGSIGREVTLYTSYAHTNAVTFMRGTTVNGKADVVLDEAYDSVTLIGDTSGKWLLKNIHQP